MSKKDIKDIEKICNNMDIPLMEMTEEDVLIHKFLVNNMQRDLNKLHNKLHNKFKNETTE